MSNNNLVLLSEVNVNETFKTVIGEFIVLEHTEDGTKVITKDLFKEHVKFGHSCDYKTSTLRELCEGDIYEAFAAVFGADNIVEHEADLTTIDMQQDYGKVNCRVRPLTFDEARKYNEALVNPELSDWWWTITPWSTPKREWHYTLAVVASSGVIFNYLCNYYFGVRPFCILKSNIFVSKGE